MSVGLGASEITLGNYGSLKGIGMIGGAVLAIWGVARFGRKNLIALTIALVSIGGLLLSTMTQIGFLLLFGIGWGVVAGLHWTTYTAVAMAISDRRIAGSMFTLFTTVMTIGLGLGDGIATSLTDNMAFSSVFLMLAVGNLILIPFAWWLIGRLTPSATPSIESESNLQPS
ncbi:MAG: MFS transporter [Chloroflexota bacterium]